MGFLDKIGIHKSTWTTRMITPYKEAILDELKAGVIDQESILMHGDGGMFHLEVREDFAFAKDLPVSYKKVMNLKDGKINKIETEKLNQGI